MCDGGGEGRLLMYQLIGVYNNKFVNAQVRTSAQLLHKEEHNRISYLP